MRERQSGRLLQVTSRATATKSPSARGQVMVKDMRQMWKQMTMMGEIEVLTELLTEQASTVWALTKPKVLRRE